MANLKNAIKQIRKDVKHTERNLKKRADLKTLIKKTRKAIDSKEKGVDELISQVQKSVDKAVQKKVIKLNTGARKLSRLVAYKNKTK